MSSLWDKPGVPRKGWRCVGYYDLREDGQDPEDTEYATCEMCGHEQIRYVHTMAHDNYETLDVGCICAEKMSEDYLTPRRNEARLKNRASRRKKWLSRKWRLSSKGNHYLNADGYNLGIFPNQRRPGLWNFWIGKQFSAQSYSSIEEAKLALFDAFWKILENNDEE